MEGEIRFGQKIGAIHYFPLIFMSAIIWAIPIAPDGKGGSPGFTPNWILVCSLFTLVFLAGFGFHFFRQRRLSRIRLAWNSDSISLLQNDVSLWSVRWDDYRGCRLGRGNRLELVDRDKNAIAHFGPEFFGESAGPNRGKLMAILKLRTPSGGVFDIRHRLKPWHPWITRGVFIASCIVLFPAARSIRLDWLKIQAVNRGEDIGYVPGTPFLDFWAWGGATLAILGIFIATLEYIAERRARAFTELGAFSKFENPPNLAEYFLAGSASPYWLEEVRFRYVDRQKARKVIRDEAMATPLLFAFVACIFLLFVLIPYIPDDGKRERTSAAAMTTVGVGGFVLMGSIAIGFGRRTKRREKEFIAGLDDVVMAREDRISIISDEAVTPLEIAESKPRIHPFASVMPQTLCARGNDQMRRYLAALMEMEFGE